MTTKKKKNNYVNNAKFFEEICKYKEKRDLAEKEGREIPIPSDYIGVCVMEIANRLSTKINFSGYTYRDEMIEDGIENAFMALGNFDPEKSNNPFAYFTQIIYYAFLRRISKEHKQSYIKRKALENFYIDMINDPVNEYASFSEVFENEHMYTDLMEKFEKKDNKDD